MYYLAEGGDGPAYSPVLGIGIIWAVLHWGTAFFCVLVLAGCGSQPDVVSIAPTLACEHVVRCHIIAWQVGSKQALAVSGTHVKCSCGDL
jgi:hypothetical protein